MTTYEYIRWKANNTRKSKIVKSKADKKKDKERLAEEKNKKSISEDLASPSSQPLNSQFNDSGKRLAGLMSMGSNSFTGKPHDDDRKDTSVDAAFVKEGA